MAIEFLEIRSSVTRELIGVLDDYNSVIWHDVWYGVGDFEIYLKNSTEHVALLQPDNYVGRNDADDVGVIEHINVSWSDADGDMLTVTGRFAKAILDRRIIYYLSGTVNLPFVLSGNVENEIRVLVSSQAIDCPEDSARNMAEFELGPSAGIPLNFVDADGNPSEKQVPLGNLLGFSDGALKEYGLSARITLSEALKLKYTVRQGTDRTLGNSSGADPVIFSAEMDNVSDVTYDLDRSDEKNVALIGGDGEDYERFFALLGSATGIERREMMVDASSLNRTVNESELQSIYPSGTFTGTVFTVNGAIYAKLVTDLTRSYSLSALQGKFPTGTASGTKFIVDGVTYANRIYGDDNDYTLTPLGYRAMLTADDKEGNYTFVDAIYMAMLRSKGKQDLSDHVTRETFDGTIDVTGGNFVLNRDFSIGDFVTLQYNNIGVYSNVRIVETAEVQDENGYTIDAIYSKGE